MAYDSTTKQHAQALRRLGLGPLDIRRSLASPDVLGEEPGLRTIESWVSGAQVGPSTPWSIREATPTDVRLLSPIVSWMVATGVQPHSWPDAEEMEWAARLVALAPGLPPAAVFRTAFVLASGTSPEGASTEQVLSATVLAQLHRQQDSSGHPGPQTPGTREILARIARGYGAKDVESRELEELPALIESLRKDLVTQAEQAGLAHAGRWGPELLMAWRYLREWEPSDGPTDIR
jgi:hypothetical protein